MSDRLYAGRGPGGARRYFLLPERSFPAGDLELMDLRKRPLTVREEDVAPFEIPEAEARLRADDEAGRLRAQAQRIRQEGADLLARLRDAGVAQAANLGGGGPTDLSASLIESFRPLIEALGEQVDVLFDERLADTPEGQARLKEAAERLKARGGPDWTDDPSTAPRKIREILSNPALADGVAAFIAGLGRPRAG